MSAPVITPLNEFITLQRGFDLPEEQRKPGSIPVVASRSIVGFHSEKRVEAPGVVIGRSGSIGGGQYLDEPFWPLNTTLWVKDFKGHNPRYVYYLLKSIDFTSFNVGAGVPTLNRNHLAGIKVKNISHDQEIKIANTIAKYDDLIENNKRRIALLEESARLLYREWFVRFRFPGHEHIKIIDGLPEGWTKVKYEDILGKVKKKGKIKKEQYQQDGLFPCIDQSKDFIAGYIDDVELVFSEPLPVLIFGDHTRIVKFIDFPFVQGADGTQIVIPKNDEITPVFFYFLTQSIDLANAFYARHFKFLKATEIILPTQNLIKQFEKSVGVNMKQIKTLREMNRKLTQARDILLPRLMNGDLAV